MFKIETKMALVLPDPFRGMRARRNSAETQQSGQASRSGPEIKQKNKDGRQLVPLSNKLISKSLPLLNLFILIGC